MPHRGPGAGLAANDDVVSKILLLLPAKELLHCALTCKAFKALASAPLAVKHLGARLEPTGVASCQHATALSVRHPFHFSQRAGYSHLLRLLARAHSLTSLDISAPRLNDECMSALVGAATTPPRLTRLQLSRVALGTRAQRTLATCLARLPQLQILHLERCGLDEGGLEALLPALSAVAQLRTLSLKDNGFTSAVWPLLERLCKAATQLRCLGIHDLALERISVLDVAQRLAPLSQLSPGTAMDHNHGAVVDSLSKLTQLKEISLKQRLHTINWPAVLTSMGQLTQLESLSIYLQVYRRVTQSCTPDAASHIRALLPRLAHLRYLHIEYKGLSEGSVRQMMEPLASIQSLTHLEIYAGSSSWAATGCGDEWTPVLSSLTQLRFLGFLVSPSFPWPLLQNQTGLTRMDIVCGAAHQDVAGMATALATLPHLRVIELQGCGTGREMMTNLLGAAAAATAVTKLLLEQLQFVADAIQLSELLAAALRMPRLRHLEVDGNFSVADGTAADDGGGALERLCPQEPAGPPLYALQRFRITREHVQRHARLADQQHAIVNILARMPNLVALAVCSELTAPLAATLAAMTRLTYVYLNNWEPTYRRTYVACSRTLMRISTWGDLHPPQGSEVSGEGEGEDRAEARAREDVQTELGRALANMQNLQLLCLRGLASVSWCACLRHLSLLTCLVLERMTIGGGGEGGGGCAALGCALRQVPHLGVLGFARSTLADGITEPLAAGLRALTGLQHLSLSQVFVGVNDVACSAARLGAVIQALPGLSTMELFASSIRGVLLLEGVFGALRDGDRCVKVDVSEDVPADLVGTRVQQMPLHWFEALWKTWFDRHQWTLQLGRVWSAVP